MNNNNIERNYVCFRTSFYHVPLEKISDDFPAEKIGTYERVCRECGPKELDEENLARCMESGHIMMLASEYYTGEWIRRHKRTCYFCMKPLYTHQMLGNCEECRKDFRILYHNHLVMHVMKNNV